MHKQMTRRAKVVKHSYYNTKVTARYTSG